MATHLINDAKPKLGSPVKQAAPGKTIYLVSGKDTVVLVPEHATHSIPVELDVPAVDRRLAASEKTPAAPWAPGDAGRIAKQVLRRKPARRP